MIVNLGPGFYKFWFVDFNMFLNLIKVTSKFRVNMRQKEKKNLMANILGDMENHYEVFFVTVLFCYQ